MTKKRQAEKKFEKLIQDMQKPGVTKQDQEKMGDLARKQINKLHRYSCKKSKR
jgi:hypothetical protein